MKRIALYSLSLVMCVIGASAQVTLSNWNITEGSLSFDLSGTFTTAETPTGGNLGLLWMADIGNTSWINGDDNPTATITGSIDGHDASNFQSVFSFTGSSQGNVGAYLNYYEDMESQGFPFDFTDGIDNEVNIHVDLSYPGKYNPENIDPVNLELYWGGDAFSGNTSSAVPMGLAVPEPSSGALLAAGFYLAAMITQHRRKLK